MLIAAGLNPSPPPPPTSASYMTAQINHERTLKQPGWLMHTSTMSELVLLSCGSLYSVYFRRILSMSVLAYWNNLLPELKIISAISQSHKILSSYAFFINPNLRLVNVTCIKWNNLNYMTVDDMAVQCFLSIWYYIYDTQTFQPLNHTSLECLKKAAKNLEIGTSNLGISKICIK